MIIAVSAGVDLSRLADGRASLQRAVDNAALSGAAVYNVNAAATQSKALVTAVAAFCEMTAALPAGFTITGTSSQTCGGGSASGPVATTQIAGYKTGTLGITASQCSAANPVVTGVTCGFIVTVSAQATVSTMIPAFFGISRTIAVTGMAANPFINIANTIKAQMLGSSYNTNSVWIYPLLLNNSGSPDYSTNPGAIPGLVSGIHPADASPSGCTSLTACGAMGTPAGVNCASSPGTCGSALPSGCTDNPLQFTCGAFTMLGNTFYNTASNPCPASAPCTPNGVGTYPTIIQGVIQNPQAPTAVITATTLLGVAFQSIAGGNQSYGYGGYQVNPANLCFYPGNAVYTTVAQVFGNILNNISGGSPALDWPKVTHWFYSSYLANGYPPSEGEILAQSQVFSYRQPTGNTVYWNTRIPSIGLATVGYFVPSLAYCGMTGPSGYFYDEFLTTTYPSSGATNASLFILQQAANASYTPPASTGYAYQRYTPAATPGYQYGALSCQSYGTNVYTFYWNDMSGSQAFGDDLDYNNGTLRISCTGASFVVLIG